MLGWRGRGGEVRPGAAAGEVVALFAARSRPSRAALPRRGGLPAGAGEELILRRTAAADGRRQAWVNDRRVTAETVRALSDTLVELHGQQDDRGLMDARGHRALLDAFAGAEAGLAAVRDAWAARAAAARALDGARERLAAAGRDREFLAHAAAELDALAPEPDEEPAARRPPPQLRAAEKIREDVARAAEALGPDGAEGPLLQALRWLETAAAQVGAEPGGRSTPPLDGARPRPADLGEVAGTVEAPARRPRRRPGRARAGRGAAVRHPRPCRKHQVAAEALPALAADFAARLAALEDGEAGSAARRRPRCRAKPPTPPPPPRLPAARRRRRRRARRRDGRELPPLKLDRARFVTEVDARRRRARRPRPRRFTVATNPGCRPVRSTASPRAASCRASCSRSRSA